MPHPGIARGLALGELGLGMWLAEKQRPIERTSSTNLEASHLENIHNYNRESHFS